MAPVFFHDLSVEMMLTMLMYVSCTLRSFASSRLDLVEKSAVLYGGTANFSALHPAKAPRQWVHDGCIKAREPGH